MHPLIIECARAHSDSGEIRRLAALGPDWDALVEEASRHAIAPLLFWGLNRAAPGAVPPAVLADLRSRFRASAKHSLVLTTELLRLLRLFDSAGIEALPFKGPAVAWQLYDPPELRLSGDLDLLVPKADLPRAIDALVAHGYRPCSPNLDIKFCASQKDVGFEGAVHLELHWRLTPAPFLQLDLSGFRSRLTQGAVDGKTVPVLNPEDLFILLCAHGGAHGWPQMRWICDLARLIESRPLDWDAVLSRARKMRTERLVLLGAALAADLSNRLPAEILTRIEANEAVKTLANSVRFGLEHGRNACASKPRWFHPRLLERLTPGPRGPGGQYERMFQFRLLETWRDRLRFCAYHLQPTPLDWESLRIPAWLFPVYYFARPFRLAWKWGVASGRNRSTRAVARQIPGAIQPAESKRINA